MYCKLKLKGLKARNKTAKLSNTDKSNVRYFKSMFIFVRC